MKVGFTTYPTAFQAKGGLEVQIRQTMAALRQQGVDTRIVQLYQEKLTDYDVIHQFSLNHASWAIVHNARRAGVPVVVSPVVTADFPVSKVWKIKIVLSVLHRLFRGEFRTNWDNVVAGLRHADAICALTRQDKSVIEKLGAAPQAKLLITPNGVTEAFFHADPQPFREACPEIDDFVLVAGTISPYKNQLGVIEAAKAEGYRTVLAGSIASQEYFNKCMRLGETAVTYLGEYEYPSSALTSLFAAAGVVVLASQREAFGMTPFEALAAGTPAILTTVSGADVPEAPPYFQRVYPGSQKQIRAAIRYAMMSERNRDACRGITAELRWPRVAAKLKQVYLSLINR